MATNAVNSPMALGSSPIGKLLMQYSIPAIIASVATSLYNIVDSIFIGHGVGAMAIAGLAITFPLMNLVIAFCVFISAGGSTICSIFLGQKDYVRAKNVLNNVLILSLIHAAVFGGLSILFLDEMLYFFGATEETIPYAREFMRIILYGTPISYLFISLNNMLRATGYPKKAMTSALLTVLVNVILAPIYIFVLKWGIAGAAFATVCGQTVGMVLVLKHFYSKSSFVHIGSRKELKLSMSIVKRIYSIGMSPFLMNVCACIVVIFINNALLETGKSIGDLAVGAFGIINRTGMLFVMIVFGITQGMQPILGFNYGANQWNRVKHTLKIGLFIGILITTIGVVMAELFPYEISALFTTDKTLIDISVTGFRISFIFYSAVGGGVIIQNFLQAIGKPKISIFLSLTRQLLFLIPSLLILPHFFGVDGVWLSLSVSDLLAFLVALATLLVLLKKENKHFSSLINS